MRKMTGSGNDDRHPSAIDFGLAAHWLKTAREAYEAGNRREYIAARQLLAITLEDRDPGEQRAG